MPTWIDVAACAGGGIWNRPSARWAVVDNLWVAAPTIAFFTILIGLCWRGRRLEMRKALARLARRMFE